MEDDPYKLWPGVVAYLPARLPDQKWRELVSQDKCSLLRSSSCWLLGLWFPSMCAALLHEQFGACRRESRTQITCHWNHKVKFWLFQLQMALAALTPNIPHCPISVLTVILRWLPHRLVFRNNLLPVSSPPGARGVRPLLRRVKAGMILILFLALALAAFPDSTFPFHVSLQSLALTWSWEGDDSLLVSDLLFLAEMQSFLENHLFPPALKYAGYSIFL